MRKFHRRVIQWTLAVALCLGVALPAGRLFGKPGAAAAIPPAATGYYPGGLGAGATEPLLITVGQTHVFGVSLASGEPVWKYAHGGTGSCWHSRPEVMDGIVFIGMNIETTTDDPETEENERSLTGKFVALNAQTGAELWSLSDSGGLDRGNAVADGVVLLARPEWRGVTAHDARTGKPLWMSENGYNQSALHGGRAFILGPDLRALDALTGKVLWKKSLSTPGGQIAAFPGIVVLYGDERGNLDGRVGVSIPVIRAFDPDSGKQLWKTQAGKGAFRLPPILVNGMIYAGCRDGSIYALSAKNGGLTWQARVTDDICEPVFCDGNRVYFADRSYQLTVFSARDGSRQSLAGNITIDRPVLMHGRLYEVDTVNTREGLQSAIRCLDGETGKAVSETARHFFDSAWSPAIAD